MHRSNTWWDNIMLSSFTDQDWLNNFQISRQTFLYLCDKLSSRLQRQDTVIRSCISVQKRVAITLWCLATPAEYRTVGHLLGVSRSSVCEIVHEMCSAIVSVLLKTYIKFPTGDNSDNIVREFKGKWGVPPMFWGHRWNSYTCICTHREPHRLLQSQRLVLHTYSGSSGCQLLFPGHMRRVARQCT